MLLIIRSYNKLKIIAFSYLFAIPMAGDFENNTFFKTNSLMCKSLGGGARERHRHVTPRVEMGACARLKTRRRQARDSRVLPLIGPQSEHRDPTAAVPHLAR